MSNRSKLLFGDQTISAVLIVKNEEKVITRCLDSLKDVVSEIVVVDTGSTDDTLKILEMYDIKIFHYQWHDDFAAARNFGLSKATSQWILIIDADEEFEVVDKALLTYLLGRDDIEMVSVEILDSVTHKVNQNPRIFRRIPEFRYDGAIHESVVYKDGEFPKVAYSMAIIFHYGYEANITIEKDKRSRNFNALLEAYKKNEKDARTLFYLGMEYRNRSDEKNATLFFEKSIEADDVYLRALAYQNLVSIYFDSKEYSKAIEKGLETIRIYPEFTDIRFTLGIIYLKMNEPRKAIKFFEDCMQVGAGPSIYPQTPEVGGILAFLFYGYCLQAMGDLKAAEKIFTKAVADIRTNGPALNYLAKLLIGLHGIDAAKKTILQLADLNSKIVQKMLRVYFPDIK